MDKELYEKILDCVKKGQDLSQHFTKEELKQFIAKQTKDKFWAAVGPYLGYALIACLILGALLAVFMMIFEFIGKILGAFSEWWGYLWGGTVSLISDDDVANLYYELRERGVDFDEIGGIGEHTFIPHEEEDLYSLIDNENLHKMAEDVLNSDATDLSKSISAEVIKNAKDGTNKNISIKIKDCLEIPQQVKDTSINSSGKFPSTTSFNPPKVRDLYNVDYWQEVVKESDKDANGQSKYLKKKRGQTVNPNNPDEESQVRDLKDKDGNDIYETEDEASMRLLTEMIIITKNEAIEDENSQYKDDATNYPRLNVDKGLGIYLNKYLLAEINTFSARDRWTFADDAFTGAIYVSDGKEETKEAEISGWDIFLGIINPVYGITLIIDATTDADIHTIGDKLSEMKSIAVERDDSSGDFYINFKQKSYKPNYESLLQDGNVTLSNVLEEVEETVKYPVTEYVNDFAMPWQYAFSFHENTLSPDVGYEVALMSYKYHDLWLQQRNAETGIIFGYSGIVEGNPGSAGDFSKITGSIGKQSIHNPRIYLRRISTWYETRDYNYTYFNDEDFYDDPDTNDTYASKKPPTSSWFENAAGVEYHGKKDCGKAKNYDAVQDRTAPMAGLTRIAVKQEHTYVSYGYREEEQEIVCTKNASGGWDRDEGPITHGDWKTGDEEKYDGEKTCESYDPNFDYEAKEKEKEDLDAVPDEYKKKDENRNPAWASSTTTDREYETDEETGLPILVGYTITKKRTVYSYNLSEGAKAYKMYTYEFYSFVEYQYEYEGENPDVKGAAMETITETKPKLQSVDPDMNGKEAMKKLLLPYPEIEENGSAEKYTIKNHGDKGSAASPNAFLKNNDTDAVRYYRSNDLSLKKDDSNKTSASDTSNTLFYYKDHLFITTSAENIIKSLHDFYAQGDKNNDDIERREYDESVMDKEDLTVKDDAGKTDVEATKEKISEVAKDSTPDEYLASPYTPVRNLILFFTAENVIDSSKIYGASVANIFTVMGQWMFEETSYVISGDKPATIQCGANVEVKAPIDGKLTVEGDVVYIETANFGIIALKNLDVDDTLVNTDVKAGQVIGKTTGNLKYARCDDTGADVSAKDDLTSLKKIASNDYVWPVPTSANITSPYGDRTDPINGGTAKHSGIDIGAAEGSPIVSYADGTVVVNQYNEGGYGNYIIIKHDDNKYTLYAHMQGQSGCAVGTEVKKNQPIGFVGTTGRSTGPHLHFEVRVGANSSNNTKNPMDYLQAYK